MKIIRLMIILTLMLPLQLMANSLPEFPFVGVDGVAEIEVTPDTATISFNLIAFSEKAEDALNTINQKSAKVFEIAESFGITRNSIISTGIQNQVRREMSATDKYTKTKIIGYDIAQVFKVKLDELSKYTDFTDSIIALGNVASINSTFDVKNRKQIQANLVKDAGKDAKQKAQNLAAAMNVKLGSVFALTEHSSFDSLLANFKFASKDYVFNSIAYDRSANMMVPKSITIKKNISVIYKLK